MSSAQRGTMSSRTLDAMLKGAVAESYPELDIAGRDKEEILHAVIEAHGWPSVVALGRGVRELTWHPVVRALAASSTPSALIERWVRLERFGHSSHRTLLVAAEDAGAMTVLTLRHVALDGERVPAVDDLFIWGILIGLFEVAGANTLDAALLQGAPPAPFPIHGRRRFARTAALPERTDVLRVRVERQLMARTVCGAAGVPAGLGDVAGKRRDGSSPVVGFRSPAAGIPRTRLAALLARDLLREWSVGQAARELSCSPRSLQRHLRNDGTTFQEVLHRARVDASYALLADERLSLTDIAFCVGFADQAHFSRVFRRFNDVPPSELRRLQSKAPSAAKRRRFPG